MDFKSYFPTGIITHQISDSIADHIEDIILPNLSNLLNAKSFSSDNVLTDFYSSKRIISKKELLPLTQEIDKCIKYYAELVKESVKGFEYWVQDYHQNQFHGLHNHGRNTLFSVVYWVRASKDAGSLVIEESNPLKKLWFSGSPWGYSKITFKPQKGHLVLFPGYLNHNVLPSKTDCIRTTIAFNYF